MDQSKLIERLKKDANSIESFKKSEREMNEFCFINGQGVLISANEARLFIELLQKKQKLNNDTGNQRHR